MDLSKLNEVFQHASPVERLSKLYDYFDESDVLFTSSFGTHAASLLHMISQTRPSQSIHFIDTGYHFTETIQYKDKLTRLFGLNVIDVNPDPTLHKFTQEENSWKNDADLCCAINKVNPLEELKPQFKVWVSGLRKSQTAFREGLDIFTQQGNLIKFAPLIDFDNEQQENYNLLHRIPAHPMLEVGYGSVGCTHCTVKGKGRSGRWQGKSKTECGLHVLAMK